MGRGRRRWPRPTSCARRCAAGTSAPTCPGTSSSSSCSLAILGSCARCCGAAGGTRGRRAAGPAATDEVPTIADAGRRTRRPVTSRAGARVRGEVLLAHVAAVHVRVDLRRRDVGVAEHLLERAQVGARPRAGASRTSAAACAGAGRDPARAPYVRTSRWTACRVRRPPRRLTGTAPRGPARPPRLFGAQERPSVRQVLGEGALGRARDRARPAPCRPCRRRAAAPRSAPSRPTSRPTSSLDPQPAAVQHLEDRAVAEARPAPRRTAGRAGGPTSAIETTSGSRSGVVGQRQVGGDLVPRDALADEEPVEAPHGRDLAFDGGRARSPRRAAHATHAVRSSRLTASGPATPRSSRNAGVARQVAAGTRRACCGDAPRSTAR